VFPNVWTQIDHLIKILVDNVVKYVVAIGFILVEVASEVFKSHPLLNWSWREAPISFVIIDIVALVQLIVAITLEQAFPICSLIDAFNLSLFLRSVCNTQSPSLVEMLLTDKFNEYNFRY